MRKELRLRRRKDFDNVYRYGRAFNNRLLVLRTLPNDLEHNRYGFVTSKRLGKAVARNRVRRRLREAVRSFDVAPAYDIIVSAKTAAAEADYHELRLAVGDLLSRAGILRQGAAGGPPKGEGA